MVKHNVKVVIRTRPTANFASKKVRILWDEKDVLDVFDKQVAESMSQLLPCNFIDKITKSYAEALAL